MRGDCSSCCGGLLLLAEEFLGEIEPSLWMRQSGFDLFGVEAGGGV